MPAIVASGLCKHFGQGAAQVVALDDVNLAVEAGEWVAVMGPSGCGKSSLLQVLGGLDRPERGTVTVDGVVVTDGSESARARLRRRRVGYVFQQYNLIGDLDVVGNVALPLQLAGSSRRAARAQARVLLDQFGLADRGRALPAELSGGQQQRAAIARALVGRPAVVLADEPTGALDSASAATVVDALSAAHRNGQTIVMVTHDESVAAVADRIVRMRDGRLQPEGGASARRVA
jgi:putative ABC transport system ATP-binding protein